MEKEHRNKLFDFGFFNTGSSCVLCASFFFFLNFKHITAESVGHLFDHVLFLKRDKNIHFVTIHQPQNSMAADEQAVVFSTAGCQKMRPALQLLRQNTTFKASGDEMCLCFSANGTKQLETAKHIYFLDLYTGFVLVLEILENA